MKLLENKTALITGASRGIGEAIAKVNGKVVCKAELTFAIQ